MCSISSLFIGLTYLPLAEATAIGFVAPLFITILSVPILKEKVGIHRWLAILIGFTGVIIIIRPGGEFWQFVSIMPLLGAIFFALFQIFTRLLSGTEKTFTTHTYNSTQRTSFLSNYCKKLKIIGLDLYIPQSCFN